MKIFFFLLILFHALIHLLGFLKGFQILELKEFTLSISKSMGLIWLGATLILISAAILFVIDHPLWWLFAFSGIVFSQILIVVFWTDAKFGSIPNALILMVAIVAFAQFLFQNKVNEEVDSIHSDSIEKTLSPINEKSIQSLPIAVQRWLKQSGIMEKPPIHSMKMVQNYHIKLDPSQKKWYPAQAEQYSTTFPPAFVWTADMKMMPLLYAFGRDKFIDGEGEMLFKLLSLFPVAKDGFNPQINESALQRYLGEIVWNPSAAIMEYISWEELDQNSAKATLSYGNTTGSGIFYFDENGRMTQFVAERYMGSGKDAKKHFWIVKALQHQVFDGISLPSKCNATWKLENEDWTWAEFEVTQVEFNPDIK
jgi:hypothetical protein